MLGHIARAIRLRLASDLFAYDYGQMAPTCKARCANIKTENNSDTC